MWDSIYKVRPCNRLVKSILSHCPSLSRISSPENSCHNVRILEIFNKTSTQCNAMLFLAEILKVIVGQWTDPTSATTVHNILYIFNVHDIIMYFILPARSVYNILYIFTIPTFLCLSTSPHSLSTVTSPTRETCFWILKKSSQGLVFTIFHTDMSQFLLSCKQFWGWTEWLSNWLII